MRVGVYSYRKRLSETASHPHVVRLPKDATSPTGSIYKHFDIVSQGRVLSTYNDAVRTVRSSEPFVLSISVNGKVKTVSSKLERKA